MTQDKYSIGDRMHGGNIQALKTLAFIAGLLVYVGVVGYSAVHNFKLLTMGVAPDLVMWSIVGVVSLELTALALPLALHVWLFSPMQRLAGFIFYGLDAALVIFNVILSFAFAIGTAAALPTWLQTYLSFIAPISPILVAAGWSILFMLDPSSRELAMTETLRTSTREILSDRIMEAARSQSHTKSVDGAAATMAEDIIAQVLQQSVQRTSPSNVIDLKAKTPSGNGRVIYNAETDAPKVEKEGAK